MVVVVVVVVVELVVLEAVVLNVVVTAVEVVRERVVVEAVVLKVEVLEVVLTTRVVKLLVGRPVTEEVVLPLDEIVPTSLISRELAPTNTLNAPVGMTHFWALTSQ